MKIAPCIRTVFLIGFFFLLFSPFAVSQNLSHRWGIGFNGSAVKMVLGQADLSTIEEWGGLSIRYGFTSRLYLDLNGAYGWVYPKNPDGSQFKHVGHYHTLLMPVWMQLVFNPLPQESFRPFFSIGGGILDWEIRDISKTTSSFERGDPIRGDV
ncbi:MAG TPA: hypothetical protein ENG82_02450, partial [Bacteroidetes bacterium]|nr:hypothetical protein [Bacteroidota bacterium]